jgi:predicted nucleotidyltransferase
MSKELNMSKTFISGEIDIYNISSDKKIQIKKMLENFYGSSDAISEIYNEEFLSFEEEWDSHEETNRFLSFLSKLATIFNKDTVARLLCEGETHNDYWGIIIKNNKLYIQRYVLKPFGDKKEFIYSSK